MSIQWINNSNDSGRNISVSYVATDSPSYEVYPRQVATPSGTPSPPNAASTVARVKKPTRKIENFETSMEYGSKFEHMEILHTTNNTISIPKYAIGDDTSLGLLPSDAVENCTLNNVASQQNMANVDSSRMAIFGFSRLLPPTPEYNEDLEVVTSKLNNSPIQKVQEYPEQDLDHREFDKGSNNASSPSSRMSNHQNDSAETVIRKRSPQLSPNNLMMFSPEPRERIPTPFPNSSAASNDEDLRYTSSQTENFDIREDNPGEKGNFLMENEFDFSDAPPQEFGDSFNVDEEFNEFHLYNTEFINDEEQVNEEDYRFLQEEDIQVTNNSCQEHQDNWSGISEGLPNYRSVNQVSNQNSVSETRLKENEQDVRNSTQKQLQESSHGTVAQHNSSKSPSSTTSFENGVIDYFRQGTSRIGESLEDYSTPCTTNSMQLMRPNFGFDRIKSPKRIPVNILDTEGIGSNENELVNVEQGTNPSNSETESIKDASSKNTEGMESTFEIPNNVDSEPVAPVIRVLDNTHKEGGDTPANTNSGDVEIREPVPQHFQNVATSFQDLNASSKSVSQERSITSTSIKEVDIPSAPVLDISLQQSIRETILEETGMVVGEKAILEVINRATPGHDPKHYACLVINQMINSGDLTLNRQLLQHTGIARNANAESKLDLTSTISFLPSFLEDSIELEQEKYADVDIVNKKGDFRGIKLPRFSLSQSKNQKNSVISSKEMRNSRIPKPSTPNKSKHSSPIKKPPVGMININYKENISGIANLTNKLLDPFTERKLTNGVAGEVNNATMKKRMIVDNIESNFPIGSDKAVMNWFSTPINEKGEVQQIKLKNILKKTSIRVRLIIRESNEFIFEENNVEGLTKPPHFLDTILPPNGMKEVYVTYKPNKAGVYSRGKLVLKPQLRGSRQNIKASISLIGFSGCAKMTFEYSCPHLKSSVLLDNECQTSLSGKFGEDIKVIIRNNGNAAGFVRLCAFASSDFKSPVRINDGTFSKESMSLCVENQDVIVHPGQNEVIIKIKHPRLQQGYQPDRIISFVLFHATEVHRQAFCIAKQEQNYVGVVPDLSLDQDFTSFVSPLTFFEEECSTSISSENVQTFFEKLKRTDFKVRFTSPTKPFYQLIPEQTFDESRLFMSGSQNCTNSGEVSSLSYINNEVGKTRDKYNMNHDIEEDANKRNEELELAVQTPNTRLAVLSNNTKFQSTQHNGKKEQAEFSVLVASKPTSEKCNLQRYNGLAEQKIQEQAVVERINREKSKHTHISRSGVFLDKTEIYFPAVRLNDYSVTKVTVKNRTKSPVMFSLNTLSPPFSNYHTNVEVKPNFYLNIPVKYSPILKDGQGPHECFLKLEESGAGGKILVVRLVGQRQ